MKFSSSIKHMFQIMSFLIRIFMNACVSGRMPVQYVIEEWDFRDLTLKMRPPVFIPRPETEVEQEKNRLLSV